jgi:SRSO17 transposase
LLTDRPRKHCDPIAVAGAGTSTERLQHLLTDATWDPQALDQQRGQALVAQSPPHGIRVLDDTGRPKQGRGSVRVARQYARTLGKVGNGVRWRQSHGPAEVAFRPTPELALPLGEQAQTWAVPCACVVTEAGDGDNPTLLRGLDQRQVAYVVGISRTFGGRRPAAGRAAAAVQPSPPRGRGQPKQPRPAPLYTAQAVRAALPADRWQPSTWREYAGPMLCKQCAAVRVHWATGGAQCSPTPHRVCPGAEGWLLGERPGPGDHGDGKW